MIVTLKKLQLLGACQTAIDKYFIKPKRKAYKAKDLLELAIANKDWSMARWGLFRLMTHKQQIRWAIYCAEQVIKIYEAKHPEDNRPRLAIAAATKYLKHPTDANKEAAYTASNAAAYAASSAVDRAAYEAASATANAANAAAKAADAAGASASAICAACAAASAVARAAVDEKMQIKLLRKGLQILEAK